jgi:hypothetical protein
MQVRQDADEPARLGLELRPAVLALDAGFRDDPRRPEDDADGILLDLKGIEGGGNRVLLAKGGHQGARVRRFQQFDGHGGADGCGGAFVQTQPRAISSWAC